VGGMRGHAFCWFSLLTVLLMAGEPPARGYGNQHDTVHFDLYRDYLIVVRGSAGPLKGLNFLLDTGASPTVLDRRVAEKLHLEQLPASIAVVGGSVEAAQATAPDLEVGPARRDNFHVLVEDLSFFQKAFPVRIDAVVGLDLLGQSAFEIDYTARAIRFDPVSPLKNSLPLRLQAGLPIVEAELNHLSVHLLLDTGASSLILFEPSTPRPPSPMRVSEVRPTPGTIGEFDRKQIWLDSLRLGEAEFGKEPAFLVKGTADRSQNFDGLISPAVLGITKLSIDLGRGVFAFSR
jgi:predicted aspartyl protease